MSGEQRSRESAGREEGQISTPPTLEGATSVCWLAQGFRKRWGQYLLVFWASFFFSSSLSFFREVFFFLTNFRLTEELQKEYKGFPSALYPDSTHINILSHLFFHILPQRL